MAGSSKTPTADNDEIDLWAIVSRLWSARWRIAITTAAGGLLGVIYLAAASPVYRADALLQIEGRNSGFALPTQMQALMGDGESRVLTEIDIIRSRLVLGEVVDELALDFYAKAAPPPVIGGSWSRLGLPDPGFAPRYAWSGDEQISISAMEIPPNWVGEELYLTVGAQSGFTLTLPEGKSVDGKAGVAITLPDDRFSLRVERIEAKEGRVFLLGGRPSAEVVTDLRKRLKISETGRQSSILRLELTAPSPDQASRILDAVLNTYLSQNVTRSSAEAQRSLEFIDSQLPVAQDEVRKAEEALNIYRTSQQSVDINYETSALLGQVTELERQLNELALKEEDYKRRFTPNHPSYQALLQDRQALEAQLDDLRQTSLSLPETQKQVFNLTRDLEVAQQVYMALLSRQQELRVVQASAIGNVRILDRAYTDPFPISPQKTRTLGLALILGLVIGVGATLALHALRRAVQGSEDLERLGLPVFASIGYSDVEGAINPRQSRIPILAVTRPTDLAVEALRSLRTALHFGMLDSRSKALVLTSPAPGAGKSFITINLAVVAAQAGQRVCLVDGDMRRGRLRKSFGLEKSTKGLADYLAGEAPLSEVCRTTDIENLSVISTGPYPPNPSELLMRKEFTELLAELDQQFDLVIIDAPPTLAVTDPVVMARNAGSALCVVRHQETAVPEIEAVIAAFTSAGAKLAGGILNGMKASSGGYGTRYYYYNQRYSYQTVEEKK